MLQKSALKRTSYKMFRWRMEVHLFKGIGDAANDNGTTLFKIKLYRVPQIFNSGNFILEMNNKLMLIIIIFFLGSLGKNIDGRLMRAGIKTRQAVCLGILFKAFRRRSFSDLLLVATQ